MSLNCLFHGINPMVNEITTIVQQALNPLVNPSADGSFAQDFLRHLTSETRPFSDRRNPSREERISYSGKTVSQSVS